MRESSHNSRSQYVQCHTAASIRRPLKTICAAATPSKLQKPGSTPVAPVISHPFQLPVIPRRAIKGMTYMPWRHIGLSTGSEGSKMANSYKAIEPAQPANKAVCMRCTAKRRPGSLITTVCTRYQGNPMGQVRITKLLNAARLA